MQTQAQIKAQIYNALYADTTLPNEIYWTSQANFVSFPCLTYEMLGGESEYAFGGSTIVRSSENTLIQINIYTDTGAMASMDTLHNQVKTVMEALNYMCIDSGQEFDGSTQGEQTAGKIVRPTRWARVNV